MREHQRVVVGRQLQQLGSQHAARHAERVPRGDLARGRLEHAAHACTMGAELLLGPVLAKLLCRRTVERDLACHRQARQVQQIEILDEQAEDLGVRPERREDL